LIRNPISESAFTDEVAITPQILPESHRFWDCREMLKSRERSISRRFHGTAAL